MTAGETVTEFIRRINAGDLEGALALCAEDIEYDNVPMDAVHGRDAAREFLAPMVGDGAGADWVVHQQVAEGDVVMNERTDGFRFGDTRVELPVAGLFRVRDGLITLWRDYFDMRTFETQMAGG
ncbi:MAG TPA: limonene-1,2-epoxide hydrolase family protein [Acidimicrobiales bacterium]|nr:limonene-1,2-epoxide hydrolase family protein [Acidimicrobiales bacterium]